MLNFHHLYQNDLKLGNSVISNLQNSNSSCVYINPSTATKPKTSETFVSSIKVPKKLKFIIKSSDITVSKLRVFLVLSEKFIFSQAVSFKNLGIEYIFELDQPANLSEIQPILEPYFHKYNFLNFGYTYKPNEKSDFYCKLSLSANFYPETLTKILLNSQSVIYKTADFTCESGKNQVVFNPDF